MEVVMKNFYLDVPLVTTKDDDVVMLRRQCEFSEDIFSYKVGDFVQTHLLPNPLQLQQITYNFTKGITRLLAYPISRDNNKERRELITLLEKDGWVHPSKEDI